MELDLNQSLTVFSHFISLYNKQWGENQGGILDLLEIELPAEPVKPEKVSANT